jgi:hypothetical protein
MKTEYEFELTAKQLSTAFNRNTRRVTRAFPGWWLIRILPVMLTAAATFILFYALNGAHARDAAVMKPIWIAALILLASSSFYSWVYKRDFGRALRSSTWFIGRRTMLTLEDQGLRIANDCHDSFIRWHAIRGVEECGDVILLILDNIHFSPIPTTAFASQEEKEAFIAHVRNTSASANVGDRDFPETQMASAEPEGAANETPLSPPNKRRGAAIRTFFLSLAQAYQLLFFKHVAEERLRLAWWQIPVFGLFGVVVLLVWNIAYVGLAGQFEWNSLPPALFHIPVLLLAAIFIAHALRRSEKTMLLMQVFLMIMLAFDLATLAISRFVPIQPMTFTHPALGISYFFLPALWLALACLMAAYRYTSAKASARVLAFMLVLIVIALPLGLVYRQGSLWEIPYDENSVAKANYGLETEALFYSQQNQLERELATLQAERKGVSDVFLVEVAGYADQDVFVKEVDSVARLFRERFDADGHIVRLVNNNKTLASAPIASVTNLKIALNRVAQIMNKEEDILFLFLTSHGSQTQFSLQLSPLKLNQLEPAQLRKMLDETGIKNRVIVVSSCYSGAFIKPLTDEHTLVISAAAANKTSFGCSNENDWTYFGDAYFNQALRKTRSFLEAFTLAKTQIAAREKQEKIEPSDPQMAVGAAMRNTLASLEQDWKTPKSITVASNATTAPAAPDEVEQYLNLLINPETVAQQTKTCIASMQMRGPNTLVMKNPEYFAGMNQSNAHWPLLMAAWDRYATSYCERSNDLSLARGLYSKYLRKMMAPEDLSPAINFLKSDSGRRWYASSELVGRQMSIELSEIQTAIEMPLSKTYLDEQAQIIKAFQAENQRDASKTKK